MELQIGMIPGVTGMWFVSGAPTRDSRTQQQRPESLGEINDPSAKCTSCGMTLDAVGNESYLSRFRIGTIELLLCGKCFCDLRDSF